MSFALTTAQYEARTKDVTRRGGWTVLQPGERFMGVRKSQGLKKGEKVQRLHASECVSNRAEPLRRMIDEPAYGLEEVKREGFPDLTPTEFVAMYCAHNGGTPEQVVQRIEFRHLDEETKLGD